MYSDPKRWSYLFESYVLLTMMEVHHRPQVCKTANNFLLQASHLSVQVQYWPEKKKVWLDDFVPHGLYLLKSARFSKLTMESFPCFK